MLRTGKEKFVCRTVETYFNTFQTKTESHLKDLGKGVLIVSIFYLIFEFTLYVPCQPKIGSESSN